MAPLKSATNGVLCTIEVTPKEQCVTADQFILFTNEGIRHVLTHCMAKGENLKVFTTTAVTMHKINLVDGTVDTENTFYFHTNATPIQSDVAVNELIEDIHAKLEKHIDRFTNQGCNWVVASIDNVKLTVVRYKILRGGSPNFEVPNELAAKHCVINIKVDGEECLKYAVVASLHYKDVNDGMVIEIEIDKVITSSSLNSMISLTFLIQLLLM